MIKKTSLAEEVANQIRKKIKAGSYAVNSKLSTEPELMGLFGVGRSSIREAIRILANNGYLRVLQGKGTFITSREGNETLGSAFQRAKLDELLEVRQLLEGKIVEKATLLHTNMDLDRIAASLADRKQKADAGQLAECIAADIDFHQQIANACGNSILAEIYSESSKHVLLAFSQIYIDTSVFVETHGSHEQLYFAIKEGDVQRSRAMLNQIIERV